MLPSYSWKHVLKFLLKLNLYVTSIPKPYADSRYFLFKQILNDYFYLFISSFLFVWKWKTFINHFLTLTVSNSHCPVNFYLKKIGVGKVVTKKELLDKKYWFRYTSETEFFSYLCIGICASLYQLFDLPLLLINILKNRGGKSLQAYKAQMHLSFCINFYLNFTYISYMTFSFLKCKSLDRFIQKKYHRCLVKPTRIAYAGKQLHRFNHAVLK